jgi:formate dehydrogenase
MVAGHHGLDELPDEITTPGWGRIRALVINAGNPVVSGPEGAKLDAALEGLDLLVTIDLVQRESHRHAHWLLPAAHWLERDDLLALTSGLHDEPYVHYGRRAVEPPDDVREEWQFCLDLTLAMRRPFLGIRSVNGFIHATRAFATVTRRPRLAFGPHWIDRLLVASSRRISWRGVMSHPHGWVFGTREFGRLRAALRTEDKKIHAAPPQLVARTRELLADPHPQAPAGSGSPTATGCGCSPASARSNLPSSSSTTVGVRGCSTPGSVRFRPRSGSTGICSSAAIRSIRSRRPPP